MAAGPLARGRPRRRGGRAPRQERDRRRTTCSPACATRTSPSAAPAACTSSRPTSGTRVAGEGDRHDLSGVVDDLLARTHKRAYLAVVRNGACASSSSAACRACRSCRAWTPRSATTRTRSRWARSCSRSRPPEAVERYIANGLNRFTPATITDPRRAPTRSCASVRRTASPSSGRSSTGTSAASPPRPRPRPPLSGRRRHLDVAPRLRPRATSASPRRCATSSDSSASAEIRADLDHGPQAHTTSLQGRRFQRRRP